MEGFLTLLNIDMKHDLPQYLKEFTNDSLVTVASVEDVVAFNKKDTLGRVPYGQALFEGIIADTTSLVELEKIKENLEYNGRRFFNEPLDTHKLDAILSINNYHSGYAAVAKYPALTIPMGYKASGEPISLTFIGKPFNEVNLLQLGYAFEQLIPARKQPIMFP